MHVFLEYCAWSLLFATIIINLLTTEFCYKIQFYFQNFYKTELNKEEMYIRYIHKLYDLHLKAQNFTGNWIQTRKIYLGLVCGLQSFATL